MRIRSKVLLVVLPLLIFPAFLIGYTGLMLSLIHISEPTRPY